MAQNTLIPYGTKFKFFEHHKGYMYTAFLLCLLGCLAVPFVPSFYPRWGTSFQGGTSIAFHFESPQDIETVRNEFVVDPRFDNVQVQTVGVAQDNPKLSQSFVVRTQTTTTMSCSNLKNVHDSLNENLKAQFGTNIVLAENTWPSCDDAGIRGNFEIGFINEPEDKTAAHVVVNPDDLLTNLDANRVQAALVASGYANIDVALNAVRSQYTIKPQGIQADALQLLKNKFGAAFNETSGLDSVSSVGADVGEKFRNDAIVIILLALGFMLLYIGIRFDTRYAPAAVISLTTTVLLTCSFIVLIRLEITLETVAALLSLVGYGINDTIVNFDRVRENVALSDKSQSNLPALINKSVNECITRTIVTTITTLVAVAPLVFLSTGTTRDFALIMLFGVTVATFNSMFISCPLLVFFDGVIKKHKQKIEAQKALEKDLELENKKSLDADTKEPIEPEVVS